jgi:hypothetical protein
VMKDVQERYSHRKDTHSDEKNKTRQRILLQTKRFRSRRSTASNGISKGGNETRNTKRTQMFLFESEENGVNKLVILDIIVDDVIKLHPLR